MEVVAGGGEDGVDGVALAVSEVVAVHTVLVLDVADDRFDCRPAPQLSFDRRRYAALLACGEDRELVAQWRVVAAVSGICQDALDLGPEGALHIGDDGFERVSVIRIAGQRHGMQGELAAPGALERGGDRDLDAELVRRTRLAFANALHFGGMQGVDFLAALSALLSENPAGQMQGPGEYLLKIVIAGDPARDVADGAPQIGPECAQRPVCPLELLGHGHSADA